MLLPNRNSERKEPRLTVAVTGAQGAGKSTFCRTIQARLAKTHLPTALVEGLGQSVRQMGFSVGSSSNTDSIAAIYAAHVRRQRNLGSGISILDRCSVDALAYVRALNVTAPAATLLYSELAIMLSACVDLIVHCTLSDTFRATGADHETPELREAVARLIPDVISEQKLPFMTVDASSAEDIDAAVEAIAALWRSRSNEDN